jgi:eukaryotic-like serine/threonine-protein kinase
MSTEDPTREGTGDREVSSDEALTGSAQALDRRHLPSLGEYRILGLIGEGGMGAVYKAEQRHPRRIVALKVIRAGVATPQLLRRFEQETEALGRLRHPGIAPIFEAGTADAGYGPQPYFAMELIDGPSLTEYARARKLSTRERLELMAKVCDAVHHAHQRGIIHRDLKPGNILVDESGQPKILDFGVARVTDSDNRATRETDMGQLIGTLAYMSPEQVLADPLELDTRSDVYALGVILYELLSGRLPYDVSRKLLHQAVQAIQEEEPTALSSVNRVYRGDVETIVAKALEKDKTRRYASAADLAADIRRHLGDEPILARPATTFYQVRKFARRHKALVSGVAAVFVVLVLGIAVSAWQAVRATRAEQAARQAEAITRDERDRATAAEQAASRERDRAIEAEVQATTERNRAIEAEVQATTERNRAIEAEAQATAERNRALDEQQRADREAAMATSINQFLQFDLLAQASAEGQAAGSKPDPDIRVRTVLDRAAARIGEKFSETPEVRASVESTIGKTYEGLGLYPEAERHFTNALELTRQLAGPDDLETLRLSRELGGLYRAQGKLAEAETLLDATVRIHRRVNGVRDPETLAATEALSTVLAQQGKFAQAEPLMKDALATARQVFGADHPTTIRMTTGLAGVYFRQGKSDEAEPLLKSALEARRRTLGADHPTTVGLVNNLAVLYHNQRRFGDAEPLMLEVLDARRRAFGDEHIETLNAMNNLGAVYAGLGKDDEAEPLYAQALDGTRKAMGSEHPRTLSFVHNMGAYLMGRRKHSEADVLLTEAWKGRTEQLGPEHADTMSTAVFLAENHIRLGRAAEAEALFTQTYEGRRKALGAAHPDTASAAAGLAIVYFRRADYAEAERRAREALGILAEKFAGQFRTHRAEALLGLSLCAQRRFDEGEPALLAGFHGMRARAASSRERLDMDDLLEQAIRMYAEAGQPEKADEWRRWRIN